MAFTTGLATRRGVRQNGGLVTTAQQPSRASCDQQPRSQVPGALAVQVRRFARRSVRAAIVVGVLFAALAPIATGAPAMGGGRIATACSNETVNPGFRNVSARFVLHGGVSCTEAHRTMRAYARAIADGRCTSEICTEVVFAGGWTCSATIPALQRPNRPIWGCERSGASFYVYRATRQSGAPANPASFTIAGELSGVAATSASNAWAIGSTGSGKTLIVHWNGTAWAQVPSPTPAGSRLSGVAATSAGNAWAVGCSSCSMGVGEPLILHWNGTTWTQVPSPSINGSLTAVAATSATDAWAIGTTTNGTLILHWNGTAWTRVPSPGGDLFGVAATSAGNAWAVGPTGGGKTLILRWNGTVWKRTPSPSPDANTGLTDYLDGVAATSAGNAWAVGDISCGCGPGGSLIERWNGKVWKRSRSPGPRAYGYLLAGVAAVSANNAWVVGATGDGVGPTKALILSWNGAVWTQVPSPRAGAYGDLTGVAVTSASNAWAVGSVYSQRKNSPDRSNYKTVILHWNGTKWA